MLKKWLLICLTLILSSCITTKTLENFSDDELAQYRQYHRGEESYQSEMQRRRQIAVNNHPEWKKEIKEAILEGVILIGMTDEQAIVSWGKPDKVNTTVTRLTKHEQWIYGYRKSFGDGTLYWLPKQYLYFDNDILTSWQN